MLILVTTTDTLRVITSAVCDVDVVASHMDCSQASPPVMDQPETTVTNITTATTTTVVAAPGGTKRRNVKSLNIRNAHASASVDVTVTLERTATVYELIKVALLAGETLEYVEGVGFFKVATAAGKLDAKLRVAADVVFATAATFADITGLTCPVEAGKSYNFESHLYHIGNATTTGAQFGIGGVAMSSMRISEIDTILGSLTAATMAAPVADVAAINTAAIAETTGAATVVMAILSGWFIPSASGTFAVRGASEVTVAAGLTVKAGSWARVWEADN